VLCLLFSVHVQGTWLSCRRRKFEWNPVCHHVTWDLSFNFLCVCMWCRGLNSGLAIARQVFYYTPALFVLVICEIGSHFYSQGAWPTILIKASLVAGMTGACQHA
jgi:hypothetical protein